MVCYLKRIQIVGFLCKKARELIHLFACALEKALKASPSTGILYKVK